MGGVSVAGKQSGRVVQLLLLTRLVCTKTREVVTGHGIESESRGLCFPKKKARWPARGTSGAATDMCAHWPGTIFAHVRRINGAGVRVGHFCLPGTAFVLPRASNAR
ncbi:hypothetical protein MRX96_008276 [Rhipicephalus microplus]